MLLSRCSSSLLHSPNPIQPKYSSKTSAPFSPNHLTTTASTIKNHERYSSFVGHSHPPALELPVAAESQDGHAGIGILEFFQGKNIFITGATGLLGKVFVEKILRSTSVGKVYLLIKAKDKEAAFDRLEDEIINSELFTLLKEKYGKCNEAFVREKVIPIVGNICEPNLGMDYESLEIVRKNVDVIIQSAASTTFNERYDLIFDTNVIAPQRVMRFAKTCNKLQLFALISTAYVNEREGVIMEKPLIMGDDYAAVDVGDEMNLLLKSPSMSKSMLSPSDATTFFKQLGTQRAQVFGVSTTYQLSKAMAEMAVNEIRDDVPLLVIRPSIVESCFREPLPGWIQGFRMGDPLIIAYGKGVLPGFYGNPEAPLDFIPVDLVANTMIAAIAKHAGKRDEPNVYHVASSVSNPMTFSDAFDYQYQYFNAMPMAMASQTAKVQFFDNFEEFSRFTRDEIFRRSNAVAHDTKMIRGCNAKVEYAQQLSHTYQFATFFKGRFHAGNSQKLIQEMSKDEQLNFEVDVTKIDWKKYFMDIHIPGLKKYIIKTNVV